MVSDQNGKRVNRSLDSYGTLSTMRNAPNDIIDLERGPEPTRNSWSTYSPMHPMHPMRMNAQGGPFHPVAPRPWVQPRVSEEGEAPVEDAIHPKQAAKCSDEISIPDIEQLISSKPSADGLSRAYSMGLMKRQRKSAIESDVGLPYTEEQKEEYSEAINSYYNSIDELGKIGLKYTDLRENNIYRDTPESNTFYRYKHIGKSDRLMRVPVPVPHHIAQSLQGVTDVRKVSEVLEACLGPQKQVVLRSDMPRWEPCNTYLKWVWHHPDDVFWAMFYTFVIVAGVTSFFIDSTPVRKI
ncbi:hypothetical protein EG329_002745 [Mollisiaceae sp. DMI_Dod_QoI]|nr:hypothetical protein EG329_002745 [Helotiales sp. DMI_Dod_QoI]